MRQPTLLDFMEYMEYALRQEELEKANAELQEIAESQMRQQTICEPDTDGTYDFSDILDIVKNDDNNIRIRRTTWGAAASVYLVTQTEAVIIDNAEYYPQPYFTMVSGDNLLPWQPDTEDILADNWVVA